jgi:GT2 family glycosyltransferase
MKTLVWVSVFNQVRELPSVLDGLAALTEVDIDVLLVNNGSRDGSEKLIHDSGHAYEVRVAATEDSSSVSPDRGQGTDVHCYLGRAWAKNIRGEKPRCAF